MIGELTVSKMCFGGNVFSWTIDQADSFLVLDSFVEGGGNFIDTADTYSSWMEGHTGGESETIIGNWIRSRGNRDQVIVATKVGKKPDREGLAPATVRKAVEEALTRLGTESVEILYAHTDDKTVPLEESLVELDRIVREGKAKHLGASNWTGPRLREALDVQKELGLTRFTVCEPQYNLLRRDVYEGELQAICTSEDVACVPFFGLASGVLTGKYRDRRSGEGNLRAEYVDKFLDHPKVDEVLATLGEIADRRGVTMAATALAWLGSRPAVVAPIASARNAEQLADLLPMMDLELEPAEIAALDAASSIEP